MQVYRNDTSRADFQNEQFVAPEKIKTFSYDDEVHNLIIKQKEINRFIKSTMFGFSFAVVSLTTLFVI